MPPRDPGQSRAKRDGYLCNVKRDAPQEVVNLIAKLRTVQDFTEAKQTGSTVLQKLRTYPEWFATVVPSDVIEIARRKAYTPDFEDYIFFGDMARLELQEKGPQAIVYVYGRGRYTKLSDGLRFKNLLEGGSDWSLLMIHIDDVPEFIQRYYANRAI